jgi:phosphotransferase system enzyme I (PtsI)
MYLLNRLNRLMNHCIPLQGAGVSPGIAIGIAYVMRGQEVRATGLLLADEAAVGREIERYNWAIGVSIEEIRVIMGGVAVGAAVADILDVQLELLQDPEWESGVLTKIRVDKKNAADAVLEVMQEFVQVFMNMQDEYLSARAADIQDMGRRVLKHLLPERAGAGMPVAGANLILVADDLSPSDLISLDSSRVSGFATRAGGKTSHVAIVARLRDVPAVVGCGEGLDAIANGDTLVLDGATGVLLVNPGAELMQRYQEKRKEYLAAIRLLQSLKEKEAVTTDGIAIRLEANIGTVEDMEQALEQGAQGVGLLRTELLFMQSDHLPTEEEQFTFYKNVLLRSGGRMVTIRTLDIGGDKQLSYFGLPKEENPFLGYRAIRISLDRKDLFLTQLRAILRASVFGKCRILLPMIGSVQEIRLAKAILAEAKEDLAGQPFDPAIGIGIMIEVPSAAIAADQLAKEVDFFSIGTNDLCQYTLAVDRMNEKIAALYDPFHPAVLRLIRYVIEQGRRYKIPVGMCGELAGDPQATLLLMGMGLEEFSMNAPSIPGIKNIILHNSGAKARSVCEKVMEMDESAAIIAYLKEINQ